MCLAVPGKIVEIKDDLAMIDYGSEKRQVRLLERFKLGEYVIVQGGIAIEKIPKKEAEEALKNYNSYE